MSTICKEISTDGNAKINSYCFQKANNASVGYEKANIQNRINII